MIPLCTRNRCASNLVVISLLAFVLFLTFTTGTIIHHSTIEPSDPFKLHFTRHSAVERIAIADSEGSASLRGILRIIGYILLLLATLFSLCIICTIRGGVQIFQQAAEEAAADQEAQQPLRSDDQCAEKIQPIENSTQSGGNPLASLFMGIAFLGGYSILSMFLPGLIAIVLSLLPNLYVPGDLMFSMTIIAFIGCCCIKGGSSSSEEWFRNP